MTMQYFSWSARIDSLEYGRHLNLWSSRSNISATICRRTLARGARAAALFLPASFCLFCCLALCAVIFEQIAELRYWRRRQFDRFHPQAPEAPRDVPSGNGTGHRSLSRHQRYGRDRVRLAQHAAQIQDLLATSLPLDGDRVGAIPKYQKADAAALFLGPSYSECHHLLRGKPVSL